MCVKNLWIMGWSDRKKPTYIDIFNIYFLKMDTFKSFPIISTVECG